jgi:hypothetical protein
MSQNGKNSSFSEIQKLKMHIFQMYWDTIRSPKKHKDLSEGAREDMGDMERCWDITEGVRDIMGNKERDLAMTGFFGPIMRRDTLCSGASPRAPWPNWGAR